MGHMSRKVALFAALAFVGLASVLYFAFPAERDWHIARWQDSIDSYSKFLDSHPSSEHAPAAAGALLALREDSAWRALRTPPTAESLATFLSQFPKSGHAAEAKAALLTILLKDAAAEYLKENPMDSGGRTADQLAEMAAQHITVRPSSLEDYDRINVILARAIATPEAAPIRISLPDIRPEYYKEAGPWLAGAKRIPSDGLHVQQIEIADAPQPNVEALDFALIPKDKGELDIVLVLRGRWPTKHPLSHPILDLMQGASPLSKRTKDFMANVAMDEKDLFTELPSERIYVTPFSFGPIVKSGGSLEMKTGDTGVHIPVAHGSILRFKGNITGLFPAYVFKGDTSFPLAFVMLKGIGLTYLSGKGSVEKVTDHTIWHLPPTGGDHVPNR